MEKKTIGKFISALRKANGMTQRELGEKLFVSDKTVSRWECDECTPELSLIPSIAEIFGITTDELLRGERNNPDREATASEDVAAKQKAKSEKQLKLMIHSRKKKFTNFSFITIGLCLLGLIAAMICDLGFSRGLLGFCLASVFLVAATICQICFAVSFRMLIDEDEADRSERLKKANTDMALGSVKILFCILLIWAFCLPIAVIPYSRYFGLTLTYWLTYGILFSAIAFLIAYCAYKIFIVNILVRREIVWLDEATVKKATAEGKLLKKISCVFAITSLVILLVTYIVTSFVTESTFIKRERFDDPDEFINYIEREYYEWYNEGYGDLPPNEMPTYEPNKKWAEIDGKEYYYCSVLYESINIMQHEDGKWEIVVTTDEADQNGQLMYSILCAALLFLHIINLIGCILWYIVGTKKRKI